MNKKDREILRRAMARVSRESPSIKPSDQKVRMIVHIRTETGWHLKKTKDFVDDNIHEVIRIENSWGWRFMRWLRG